MAPSSSSEQPLSLYTLDKLVGEFLVHDKLLRDCRFAVAPCRPDEAAAAAATSQEHALVKLTDAIRNGTLDEGTFSLFDECNCPGGDEMRFRLVQQQFIELVRQERLDEAVALSRVKLAPLALNAHADAYTDFKRAMFLLVAIGSPISALPPPLLRVWDTSARETLANDISLAFTEERGLHEADFALLIRFLSVIHHNMTWTTGDPAEYPEIESFLAGTTRNNSNKEAPGDATRKNNNNNNNNSAKKRGGFVSESDALALSACLGMSLRAAYEAIREANTSVTTALSNELGRIRLAKEVLYKMSLEYATFRQLSSTLPSDDSTSSASMMVAQSILSLGHSSDYDSLFTLLAQHSIALPCDLEFTLRLLQIRGILRAQQSQEQGMGGTGQKGPNENENESVRAIETIRAHLTRCINQSPPNAQSGMRDQMHSLTLLTVCPSALGLSSRHALPPEPSRDDHLRLIGRVHHIVCDSLNVPYPRLVSVVRHLLFTRQKWLSMQSVTDPFSRMFSLHQLGQDDAEKEEGKDTSARSAGVPRLAFRRRHVGSAGSEGTRGGGRHERESAESRLEALIRASEGRATGSSGGGDGGDSARTSGYSVLSVLLRMMAGAGSDEIDDDAGAAGVGAEGGGGAAAATARMTRRRRRRMPHWMTEDEHEANAAGDELELGVQLEADGMEWGNVGNEEDDDDELPDLQHEHEEDDEDDDDEDEDDEEEDAAGVDRRARLLEAEMGRAREEDTGEGLSGESITMLMEVMALPREVAIRHLRRFRGDLDRAIASLLP